MGLEMAHWLRALAALAEALSPVPSAHTEVTSIWNLGASGSHALLGLCTRHQTCTWYIYMHTSKDSYT